MSSQVSFHFFSFCGCFHQPNIVRFFRCRKCFTFPIQRIWTCHFDHSKKIYSENIRIEIVLNIFFVVYWISYTFFAVCVGFHNKYCWRRIFSGEEMNLENWINFSFKCSCFLIHVMNNVNRIFNLPLFTKRLSLLTA